jgi:hypothetical protein
VVIGKNRQPGHAPGGAHAELEIAMEGSPMGMNRVQFQPGLSMPEFFTRFGTEVQCAAAPALKRQLGVSYPTAWPIHHKLMQAMADREERYVLAGRFMLMMSISAGNAGGKAGRGSENEVPFVVAVSLIEDGAPSRTKLTLVPGFTRAAIAHWANDYLAPGNAVFSDGLGCFSAVTEAGCIHHATVVAGRKPNDMPEFKWITTVLGNLKTSLSGSYHAFAFRKYGGRYLAAFTYRFNRLFDLRTLPTRLLAAAAGCTPRPLRSTTPGEVPC